MKRATAEAIVSAAKSLDLDIILREEYSGRGMYGKSTTAIIACRQSSILQAVALASVRVYQECKALAEHTEFLNDLDFSYDSMGRDIVAY